MKKVLIFIVVIILAGFVYYLVLDNSSSVPAPSEIDNTPALKVDMKITSPEFNNNGEIPVKYTCDGEGINPPLEFSDVPERTKELVLIMDDPDAPTGTWLHWTLWGIDPATSQIAENSVPSKAIQGKTSSGQNNYGGPCPPSGTHRYFFKLFALDTKLKLPSYSEKQDLEQAMAGNIIEQAELIGLYSRK